jgi:putative transposase
MPKNLKRYYGRGDFHCLTFSCYRRLPLLGAASARDLFVRVIEAMRERYEFPFVGYVVMPEHVHLLVGEPKKGTLSVMLAALKQRVSRDLRKTPPVSTTGGAPTALVGERLAFGEAPNTFAACGLLAARSKVPELPHFWMDRFYDFNVRSAEKRREKLDYMHANPVKRELVTDPKDWVWSSYAAYSGRGTSLVEIDYVH